jgi:hypothetical protein
VYNYINRDLGLKPGQGKKVGFALDDFVFKYTYNNSQVELTKDQMKQLAPWFAEWLNECLRENRPQKNRSARFLGSRPEHYTSEEPARWLLYLKEIEWVPCTNGSKQRPEKVLLTQNKDNPNELVAEPDLQSLWKTLQSCGLEFKTATKSSFKILQGIDTIDSEAQTAKLLKEALDIRERNDRLAEEFTELLNHIKILHIPLNRWVLKCRVKGTRAPRFKLTLPDTKDPFGGFLKVVSLLKSQDLIKQMQRLSKYWNFPINMAATQVLLYVQHVWKDAAAYPTTFAVGDHAKWLAKAYSILVSEDHALLEQKRADAFLYVGNRGWMPVSKVYYNDLGSTFESAEAKVCAPNHGH